MTAAAKPRILQEVAKAGHHSEMRRQMCSVIDRREVHSCGSLISLLPARSQMERLREKASQAEGEADSSRSRAERLQEQLDKAR